MPPSSPTSFQLDDQIHMVHRLDNLAHRSLERTLERDRGLELGL